MFALNYAKGVGQMCKVGWTCKHILMHVHILTKVWNQIRNDTWDHTGKHMFACNYGKVVEQTGNLVDMHTCTDAQGATQFKGTGADMGSLVDIGTHTDACTESISGMSPNGG